MGLKGPSNQNSQPKNEAPAKQAEPVQTAHGLTEEPISLGLRASASSSSPAAIKNYGGLEAQEPAADLLKEFTPSADLARADKEDVLHSLTTLSRFLSRAISSSAPGTSKEAKKEAKVVMRQADSAIESVEGKDLQEVDAKPLVDALRASAVFIGNAVESGDLWGEDSTDKADSSDEALTVVYQAEEVIKRVETIQGATSDSAPPARAREARGGGLGNRLEAFHRNVEAGLNDLLNYGLGRPEVKLEIEKTIVEAEALASVLSKYPAGREAISAGLWSAGRGDAAEGIGVIQDAMQYGLTPEVEAAARKALRMLQR